MVGELSRPILFSLKWYWNYNIYIYFNYYQIWSVHQLFQTACSRLSFYIPTITVSRNWTRVRPSFPQRLSPFLINQPVFIFFIGTLIHYFTTYGCCNVKMLSKCKMCDFCINCMYQFILFKTWYTFPLVLLCFMLKCVLHKGNYCLRG